MSAALGQVVKRRLGAINRVAKPLGFHVWMSDEGRVYATRINSLAEMASMQRLYGGLWAPSGLTLDAPSIPAMQELLLNLKRAGK